MSWAPSTSSLSSHSTPGSWFSMILGHLQAHEVELLDGPPAPRVRVGEVERHNHQAACRLKTPGCWRQMEAPSNQSSDGIPVPGASTPRGSNLCLWVGGHGCPQSCQREFKVCVHLEGQHCCPTVQRGLRGARQAIQDLQDRWLWPLNTHPIQQLRKGYYLETEGLLRAEVPALG